MPGIIKGHKGSSYFSIQPVKIIDINEDTDYYENIEYLSECEISIEEDDIDAYLFYFFFKFFDAELKENMAREGTNGTMYNTWGYSEFEWNLTHNFYTFEDMENMIKHIREIIKILINDFESPVLDLIKEKYDWLIGYTGKMSKEVKDLRIKEKRDVIIEFYHEFIFYLENMMEEGKEQGYNLISIMGP